MKKRFAAVLTAGLAVSSLVGCQNNYSETTASASEQIADNSSEAVLEETSKKVLEDLSGSITLYTSQPEEDIQVMIDGFNKKWPDIQVDVFRSGTEEVVSKVLAEKEAGDVLADVLLVADNVTFETLKEQDLLSAYESPELEGIPEIYIDKDHMYVGTKVITTGIVYNTELTENIPAGFKDLTNEAYKDDLIMPSPLYSGAAAYNLGVLTRTEGLGWDYYQTLKDNGVVVGKGNGSVQNAVVVFHNRGVISAIHTSLTLAVVTTLVCIVAGTAIAYGKLRKKSRAAALLEKCASLTYAIPGIVLALSMIFHWVEPIPGVYPGIYGTINILVVAYITRYLVLQIKGSTIALLSVEPAIEEACAASGRGFWIKWIKILIPLVAGPILSGAFMIFVPAFTELTLSSMLASAGTKTIGLTIFNYQQGGDYNLAAAMSVLITILVVAGYCLLNRDHLTSVKQEENGYEPTYTAGYKNIQQNPGPQGN